MLARFGDGSGTGQARFYQAQSQPREPRSLLLAAIPPKREMRRSSPCCGPNAGGQVAVAVSATQVPLTSPDGMVVQLRTRTQVRDQLGTGRRLTLKRPGSQRHRVRGPSGFLSVVSKCSLISLTPHPPLRIPHFMPLTTCVALIWPRRTRR